MLKAVQDLIHGASVNKPSATRCRVTLNYVDDEGNPRTFSRMVQHGSSSEYRVDGEAVSPSQYNQALQEINIFIKAHNFLVYQGAVEQIAMQSPKEMTQMFEELSR